MFMSFAEEMKHIRMLFTEQKIHACIMYRDNMTHLVVNDQ